MAKVDISESKKKSIVKAIRESNFFIAGNGCFDLIGNDYNLFIGAILSNNPVKELEKLYEELSERRM